MPRAYAHAPPSTTVPGRDDGLAVRLTPPPAAAGAEPCTPNITGLVWIDPSDQSETDTAVLTLQSVTIEYGPGDFAAQELAADDWNWEARIQGGLCIDCAVNWSVEWDGDVGVEPGYRFRWDWGILYPRTDDNGARVTHGVGTLTVSAEIVCPGHATINVGPITAVVSGAGSS